MNVIKLFMALIFSVALLSSCSKEEVSSNQFNTKTKTSAYLSGVDGDEDESASPEEDCFNFVYPVTILFPDGTDASVADDEELETAIDSWYDANEEAEEDPTLQFPVDVTLPDGSNQSIADEAEFEVLIDSCEENEEGEDDEEEDGEGEDGEDEGESEDCEDEMLELCFEFVYPIELILSDSTSVSINSLEELLEAINTDEEEEEEGDDEEDQDEEEDGEEEDGEEVEISFEYPVSVVLEDGSEQDITSDEEFHSY